MVEDVLNIVYDKVEHIIGNWYRVTTEKKSWLYNLNTSECIKYRILFDESLQVINNLVVVPVVFSYGFIHSYIIYKDLDKGIYIDYAIKYYDSLGNIDIFVNEDMIGDKCKYVALVNNKRHMLVFTQYMKNGTIQIDEHNRLIITDEKDRYYVSEDGSIAYI